jgi:hypothetical protein
MDGLEMETALLELVAAAVAHQAIFSSPSSPPWRELLCWQTAQTETVSAVN